MPGEPLPASGAPVSRTNRTFRTIFHLVRREGGHSRSIWNKVRKVRQFSDRSL